jgi:tRNA-2-methylthio-N6-dimethylallyladenosine synthase
MNISDGELMRGILASDGYEIVDRPDQADVVLVNTCAIRENAERRVLGRVGELKGLKRSHPDLLIGVTGCMAQRMGATLLEKAPYVDLIMGPDGYRSLPDQLRTLRNGQRETRVVAERPRRTRRVQLAVLELDDTEHYEGLEVRRRSEVTAWIPIQRGCDHRCTFCIVPYVRGPEKNRAPEDILAEASELARTGVTEVTLLGQTVNSYRREEWTFPALLRAVSRLDGIGRVRFTSPHPNDVTEELIEVMASEDAVCEQLHLPVQSGSDRTLKRMARKYSVESYLGTVEKVRRAIPDIALSTDIIVGFPGETDAEFEETLDLMRSVRFDDAYTYKYSSRDGTPATRLPVSDFLPESVRQARLETLISVARQIQLEISEGELGRVEEVLVERTARQSGQLRGKTRRNKVVAFPSGSAGIGDYVLVELTGTSGATFSGRITEAPALVETA